MQDEWDARVENWNATAGAAGRTIAFEFWGKHEFTSMLVIDDPRYSGRRLYWFNEPVLCSYDLRHLALKSRDTLGDRFTPEFHVDLPIARQFDGLCANDGWWSEISTRKAELEEQYGRFIRFVTSDKIEDANGNVIGKFTPQMHEIFSESTAYKMIYMMRAVVDGGTGGRIRSRYGLMMPMGGKTGTTQNNSDGWFMGYTPSLVSGVWVGGEDRSIHFDNIA